MPAPQLTDAQVMLIRQEKAAGMTLTEICQRHGLSKSNASDIVNGKRYKHLPVLDHENHPPGRVPHLPPEKALDLQRRWANGEPVAMIAASMGIPVSTVGNYTDAKHRPAGLQWQRVGAREGAKYRDALIEIARGDDNHALLARMVLDIDDEEDV